MFWHLFLQGRSTVVILFRCDHGWSLLLINQCFYVLHSPSPDPLRLNFASSYVEVMISVNDTSLLSHSCKSSPLVVVRVNRLSCWEKNKRKYMISDYLGLIGLVEERKKQNSLFFRLRKRPQLEQWLIRSFFSNTQHGEETLKHLNRMLCASFTFNGRHLSRSRFRSIDSLTDVSLCERKRDGIELKHFRCPSNRLLLSIGPLIGACNPPLDG